MKRALVVFLTLAAAASAQSPFAGKWEGKMNGLPGVDLTMADAAGKVSGSIVFYFQQRGDDGRWHVKGEYTEPLLAPQANGKVLTFEVPHHKSHGSPALGRNVKFRFELTSSDSAALQNVSEHAPPVTLSRRE